MNSLIRWIGPTAVAGGLGAAAWCGAGIAAADAGSETSSVTRVAQASAAGPARQARVSPARANARIALPASAATPAARASAATGSAGIASAAARNRRVPAVDRAVPSLAASRVSGGNNTSPAASAVAAASTQVMPSNVPVDAAQFAGTYYEQGSVKQFFSIGLVNTKAVYTVKPDGTLRVQNSGN